MTDPESGTKEVAIGEPYAPFPEVTREHYNLLGWFTAADDGEEITVDSTKTTEGDETLYAHWEEYQYTIRFDPNFDPGEGEGTMSDMTMNYSDEKPLIKNEFTREGYTFLGWNENKDATSAQYQDQQIVKSLSEVNNDEVILYAIWQSLPTVTFDPNGGSACDPSSKQVAQGALYGDLPETTRDKYTFLGWFTELEGGTEITKDSVKATNENETLHAHWEEYQYTIEFDANGGEGSMDDMKLKYSQKAPLTTNAFTRTDYKFLGWNTNPTATSAIYADGAEVQSLTDVKDGTVTLYAVWQAENSETPPPASGTPTVTFDPNGGSACNPSSKKVAQGAPYGDLPETTRDKYTFLGWFTELEGGTEITKDSTKATNENETLYAHWEEYQYTIKFDANGGEGSMDNMTLKYSQKAPLTKNAFTRPDYEFLGWNRNQNATSAVYADGAEVQSLTDINGGTVALYAVWQAKNSETPPPASSTPTVTFDPNGGSACNPSSKKVAQGAPYGDLPETTRDKYKFLGWFTELEGGTEITKDSTKATDADETLYAHWEEYQYTVKFDANGGMGTMSDMTLKYSQKTSLTKNAFTRSGYQFKGWNTDKDAVLVKYKDKAEIQSLTGENNGVVTLYAVWQKPSKEAPPNPPEKDPPKKTPDSPNGGDNASQPPEIVKTYVVQKIENVKTSDSIYIYRYIIMFVMGAGLIFLSYRFKKKQS